MPAFFMSTFSAKTSENFLVAVRAGGRDEVCAAHAEISLETMHHWFATEPEFKAQVDKARSDLSLLAIGTVRRGMAKNPASAMWLAERFAGDAELERLKKLTT